MLKWISSFFMSVAFSITANATVDGHTNVYLVVKHIQSDEFFVERAPVIGCYGPARGPQLAQFTTEYKVNNVGCGMSGQENINYLVCAKVVSAKESDDYMSYSEITLDISQCADKNDTDFLTTLRKAARLNFPLKKGKVKLVLLK